MLWIQTVLRKWLQGIIELTLFLPLLLVLFSYFPLSLPLPLWIGSLAFFYLVGIVSTSLLGIRSKWIYLLLSFIFASLFVMLATDKNVYEISTWFIGIFLFYRGHLFWSKKWVELFPLSLYWLCMAVYFVCSLVFSRVEVLKPLFPLLNAAGFISLIITLWMTNSISLQNVNFSGKKVSEISKSIKRHNRMAVALIIFVIFFIAFFNTLKDILVQAILAVIRFIIAGIIYLASLFGGAEEEPPPVERDVETPEMPPLPEGEPALWAKIMEIVMYFLVGIFGLVVLYFGIRALSKLIVKGIHKLIVFLKTKGLMNTETSGYIDEKTKTVTLKGLGMMYKDRLQQWLFDRLKKEPKWKDLKNNRDRVRYVYRHWLIHRIASGYAFKHTLTPKETGEDLLQWRDKVAAKHRGIHPSEDNSELTALYNEARYGNKDINDDKVSVIKNKLNKD
jgi:hypothetical protein